MSYIGITGFTSRAEVRAVLAAVHEALAARSRHLMCGVLATAESIGRRSGPGVRKRYPARDAIGGIFVEHPLLLNLVHHAPRRADLASQLEVLARLAGPGLHGFQLNVAWPEPGEIARWREAHPSQRIVLQVSGRAFAQVDRSPAALCQRLRDYERCITDVLFDLSGGRGHRLRVDLARQVLAEIRAAFGDGLGLGVAGGLGPDTLDSIEPLLREFPRLSIDAESRLRNEHDELELSRCIAYVQRTLQMGEE